MFINTHFMSITYGDSMSLEVSTSNKHLEGLTHIPYQLLSSAYIQDLMLDTSQNFDIQLTLLSTDGKVHLSFGEAKHAQQNAQFNIHYHLQPVAYLIGYGTQTHLAQITRMIGSRIEEHLATESEFQALFRELQQASKSLSAIYMLTKTLDEAPDAESIANIVMQAVIEAVDAYQATLILFHGNNGQHFNTYTLGDANDAPQGSQASYHVSLIVQGEQIGYLSVHGKKGVGNFTSSEQKLIEGIALQTAHAFHSSQSRQQDIALSNNIYHLIAAGPQELVSFLQYASEVLANSFQLSLVECWFVEDNLLQLKAIAGDKYRIFRPLSINHNNKRAFQEQQTIFVTELQQRQNGNNTPSLVCQLCVPFSYNQQVIGVFNLANIRAINPNEQELIEQSITHINTVIRQLILEQELQGIEAQLSQQARLATIGTLAAGISHEFNNVLTSIQGFTEIALQTNAEQREEALQIILRSTKRGVSITRGLLTMARTSQGQQVTVRLSSLVDEALSLLGPDLHMHNIQVECNYRSPALVQCDPTEIVQVLLNLITNARDAMLTTGGTLTLNIDEGAKTISLAVQDTGTGISNDMIERIFEPFVTSKGMLNDKHLGGTGLGLSISRNIVQNHGGELYAVPNMQTGSCFMLILPQIGAHISEPSPDFIESIAHEQPIQSQRILLVEDDADVRTLLSTLLQNEGHEITLADQGQSAIDLCQHNNWDLIICDIGMPQMDGEKLLSTLQEQNIQTPVIVITGNGDRNLHRRLLTQGATIVLAKPFTATALLRTISNVVQTQHPV
jgi:signal transduction histidine kinase/ActR/RegA family two-component response regulator